jgi:hypothetical protein
MRHFVSGLSIKAKSKPSGVGHELRQVEVYVRANFQDVILVAVGALVSLAIPRAIVPGSALHTGGDTHQSHVTTFGEDAKTTRTTFTGLVTALRSPPPPSPLSKSPTLNPKHPKKRRRALDEGTSLHIR